VAHPLDAAALKAAALAVGDMPSGFIPGGSGRQDDLPQLSNAVCEPLFALLRSAPSPTPHASSATAEFSRSADGPFVFSRTLSYNGAVAQQTVKAFQLAAANCHQTDAHENGRQIRYTVGALSVPRAGDQSAGAKLEGSTEGRPVETDVAVVRVGANIAVFANAGWLLPAPEVTGQLVSRSGEKLAEAAAGRTPTPSAPPPPGVTAAPGG